MTRLSQEEGVGAAAGRRHCQVDGGGGAEQRSGRVYDADARARLTRAVALIGNNELERHLTCTAKPEASFGGG